VTHRRLSIGHGQTELPAVLTLPAGPARAGLVPLHPADDRSHSQFLFEHLARLLPARGVAVLRYDRRPMGDGRDVPYQVQVDDLRSALDVLTGEIGPVPIGLWGFSQGAWERQQRGDLPRAQAQAVVNRYQDRAWFPLAWVPPVLPDGLAWDDMDFDPAVAIGGLTCPVLAFYGDDAWIPVQESIEVWRRRFPDPARLTIRELPGTTHYPTLDGGRDQQSVSPDYTATLTGWLDGILGSAGLRWPRRRQDGSGSS
jgi:uncharacterized protein